MHILLATPAFPPFIGGGERHTGTLATHLVDSGQSVTVLTSSALKEPDFWLGGGHGVEVEDTGSGLRIIRMPIRPAPGGFRGLLAWRKAMVMVSALPGTNNVLQRMAERVPYFAQVDEALDCIDQPVDVVHGFNISWEHAMMVAWQYAYRNGLPFVASPLAHLGTDSRDRVAMNSTMRHQRYILSTADMLLTNTLIEAQGLQARGVQIIKFGVAGPGIDIPQSTAEFPESSNSWNPYVLYIGRASYDKGAFDAVRAVLRLRDRGSDIHLVMLGQETEAFRRFYDELPDSEKRYVHVLGFVEEGLKHAYLRDALALLLPSRTDSFGIVLLESWYHGRPVIAAAAGGIPGVVDNGKNGILVPFGDIPSLSNAIKLLMEDRELNQILGENGRQKLISNYTWEAVTEKVLSAYREVTDLPTSA